MGWLLWRYNDEMLLGYWLRGCWPLGLKTHWWNSCFCLSSSHDDDDYIMTTAFVSSHLDFYCEAKSLGLDFTDSLMSFFLCACVFLLSDFEQAGKLVLKQTGRPSVAVVSAVRFALLLQDPASPQVSVCLLPDKTKSGEKKCLYLHYVSAHMLLTCLQRPQSAASPKSGTFKI